MKKLCRRGRPQKDSYRPLHVVAVVDDRDARDGEVCFQFRGANRQLLTRTFDYLIGCGHGIAQRVTVREAHDVIRRIGKNLQRIEVTLHGITPPHNLNWLQVLIIQFQNTKLLLHKVPLKRPTQQDSHRFGHERAARCPPPFFAAWAATRV